MSSSSSSSSSSERSSSSPEPDLAISLKGKGKGKVAGQPRNEGTDPTWAFQPPPGRVVLESVGDVGSFDWDAVESNDDVELWVIRAPDAVKPKHLSGLKIDPPSSSKSQILGCLKKKHATFDIWSIGSEIQDGVPAGGEEINSLSCLLPRSKKNRLQSAPKPIARRLVLAARGVSPSETAPDAFPHMDPETNKFKNPPRPSYPEEVLRHSFKPYGSHTTIVDSMEGSTMDVDSPSPAKHQKHSKESKKEAKSEGKTPKEKSKSKKRKVVTDETVDEASPKKKSKKSKSS